MSDYFHFSISAVEQIDWAWDNIADAMELCLGDDPDFANAAFSITLAEMCHENATIDLWQAAIRA